jgi:hypothetical protein
VALEQGAGSERMNEGLREDRQHLKDIQDQGRAVWVACATIVGLILFKAS